MFKMDRTVKILLGLIVVFLGILVVRPATPVAPSAMAQITPSIGSDGLVTLGAGLVDVGTLPFEAGKSVKAVYVVDSAKSFVVQYDDRFRVFSIQDVKVPATSLPNRSTTGR